MLPSKQAHHTQRIQILTLVLAASAGWAEDDGHFDHYVQVDLGTKWYDLSFHHDQAQADLTGQFDDSVVVSPTVCCRIGKQTSNFNLILTGGLAYGSFLAPDLEVDTFEFHLGVGAAMKVTPWAHFDVMASIGRGYTWIELPTDIDTWDHQDSAWGYSSHAEVVASFAVNLHGARISANAGYRITTLTLSDPDNADHYDDYRIHGFVVGGAVGFTF
jgi:hypothetical protein